MVMSILCFPGDSVDFRYNCCLYVNSTEPNLNSSLSDITDSIRRMSSANQRTSRDSIYTASTDELDFGNNTTDTIYHEANNFETFYLHLKEASQFPIRLYYFVNSSYLHGIRFLDSRYGTIDR